MFKSGILTRKCLENDPANAILLYMKIVNAALNTIEELAKAPNKGNLSKVPYKDINSPMKFNVKGVPALPKQSIKNNIDNIGITWAIPL